MIGTSSIPTREQSLLAENERLREELRCLREQLTPKSYRWYRLGLTRNNAQLLDLFWNDSGPLPAEIIYRRLNLVREQHALRMLSDVQCVNVLILRLRRCLEEKFQTQPIRSIKNAGYVLDVKFRSTLEPWMN